MLTDDGCLETTAYSTQTYTSTNSHVVINPVSVHTISIHNILNPHFLLLLIYLPEVKYRRILNKAFGPGGWALMPRGETMHFQVCLIITPLYFPGKTNYTDHAASRGDKVS